jgi:phosphoglycolate phosphatase
MDDVGPCAPSVWRFARRDFLDEKAALPRMRGERCSILHAASGKMENEGEDGKIAAFPCGFAGNMVKRMQRGEKSPMYRYLFFDLDGTLTDSKEGILNCLRFALEKMGQPIPPESTLIRFIGPPLQESFTRFCGFSEEQAVQGIRLFRERYGPIGKFENMPAPGMAELCRRLKERGYVLAVASSKPEEMCVPICEKFGFAPAMETIVGSPPVGDWEKADVIRETMRRLGLTEKERAQILMVGDRKFDVLGAAACGIDCAGVEFFGYAAPGELAEAGAVAVVRTAEELETFILSH